jgi:hypothetical protein
LTVAITLPTINFGGSFIGKWPARGIDAYHDGSLRSTEVVRMYSIDPMGGLTDAHQRLVQVWADPQIKRLAQRHARDPQLADDALQSTYYALARLKHLDQIENMRAYFCRVLVQQVHRESAQLGAALVEDFAFVADVRGSVTDSGFASSPEFEEAACFSIQAWSWHKRLIRQGGELAARVPARSGEPTRYRAMIYAAAEQILRAGIDGEPSKADTNDAFLASYPEYFDQPGASRATRDQRLCRARMDVGKLLRAVVGPAPV